MTSGDLVEVEYDPQKKRVGFINITQNIRGPYIFFNI